MNEKEYAELAAGYALAALSPEDARIFTIAREQHPEWEHHIMTDAATIAVLADSVAEVAPPPALRATLLAQIGAAPSAEVSAAAVAPSAGALRSDRRASSPQPARIPEASVPRRWGARTWFTLAASLAVLIGVGWGGAIFATEQLNPPASVVALGQIESAPDAQSETVTLADSGEVTAHWSESVGKVVLVSDGLPTITDDQTFQLWFVREDGPVSAGTFTPDGDSATALLDGSVQAGDVIAVTVEPAGGSPTGQPTSDPIVAIETA